MQGERPHPFTSARGVLTGIGRVARYARVDLGGRGRSAGVTQGHPLPVDCHVVIKYVGMYLRGVVALVLVDGGDSE